MPESDECISFPVSVFKMWDLFRVLGVISRKISNFYKFAILPFLFSSEYFVLLQKNTGVVKDRN